MKPSDVLDLLDGAIQDAAKAGVTSIEMANMQQFAQLLRKTVSDNENRETSPTSQPDREANLERMRADLTNWIEQHKRKHEWDVELFRSAVSSGQNALKACLLINGGASVALLAFAGHLVEQAEPTIPIRPIAVSMAAFVTGVFAGGLTAGATYLSQWFFAGRHERTGFALNIISILLGLASLGFFCLGGYLAYSAISR